MKRHTFVVVLLLEHGMNPNYGDRSSRHTLSSVTQHGNDTIVQILLRQKGREEGGQVDLGGAAGRTALAWAASQSNRKIVNLLLEHGADINLADHQGRNPFLWAAEKE